MTMPAASPRPDEFEEEARQLAGWLRTRRISALVGAAGSGRTSLLKTGVLPLLRRRAADVARVPASRVVIPFPERRRRGHAGSSEVAVFFDAWDDAAPLARLLACIHQALGLAPPEPTAERLSLAGSLAALNMQTGARFLLILDRFEQCLQAASEQEDARHLVDELVQALNRPLLPVHALVCVSDTAGPLLAALFGRIPGNDEQALHLGESPDESRAAPPGLWPVPSAVPAADVAADTAPEAEPSPPPVLTEAEWFASIGALVARVADTARHDGLPAPALAHEALPTRADAPATEPAPAMFGMDLDVDLDEPFVAQAPAIEPPLLLFEAPVEVPVAEAPTAPAPDFPRAPVSPIGAVAIPWFAWAGAAVAAAIAAYFVWPAAGSRDGAAAVAPAPAVVAVAPAPPPIAAPAPHAPLALTDDGSVRWRRELASALGSAEVPGAAFAWPPGFDAVPGQPQLAVARYSALQAARAASPGLPLEVVTPLASEAVYFVVQADSPRVFIHDMRGAALNLGPAGSARALTAEAAYRRLFGAAPLAAPAAGLDPNAALGPLLRGEALDVLVLVDTPPTDWLARLPPATASALRVLKLDPTDAADQRALQTFLPTRLPASAKTPAAASTLGEMSFLVTADEAQGGRAAASLCSALPGLRRDGAPAWRELTPGQVLPTGWPMSPAAQRAWRDCRGVSG